MKKCMFLGFLSMTLTAACHLWSPDSPSSPPSAGAENNGEALSLKSDVGAGPSSAGSSASGPSSSGTAGAPGKPLERGRFVSLEEAEERVNLIRMCDFKDDHIVETVSFSGHDIIVKGSEEPAEISDIIKRRTWRDLLEGDFAEDFERAGRQAIPEGEGRIVTAYFYDRDEKYGYWCPPEEQEECIVQVIYRGSIERRAASESPDGEGFLSDWLYTGDLKVQIHFSDRVLSFSRCSSEEEGD